MNTGVRIAVWSGPRNLSTALMRSWGNRSDTYVTDEPFYAHYLRATGAPHPGAAEVMAACETDWRKVAAWLAGPIPEGRRVWYQKHMAHHWLPGMDRAWCAGVVHVFLIRAPDRVIPSLRKLLPRPDLPDTGFPQQVELFRAERERTGRTPPVIDAADLLADPRGVLAALCRAVGVPFEDAMLSWPGGRRDTDGIWAKHWYASVERSTGFEPDRPSGDPVPADLEGLLGACRPLYEELHEARLTPAK